MDKREFQKSLEAYYREKGKHPPPQTPVLAGKPISLHLLFERVTKLGGSYILSNEDRWQDILQGIYTATTCSSLHLPPSHDELVQRRPTNLDRPIFKLFL